MQARGALRLSVLRVPGPIVRSLGRDTTPDVNVERSIPSLICASFIMLASRILRMSTIFIAQSSNIINLINLFNLIANVKISF